MRRYLQIEIFIAFLIAVLGCTASYGQTITGNVNGTVTDPSGAVIPNAKVTATNVDTGVATATTTNNDGIYNIRFLQIGNYKILIESPGFTPESLGPFVLETDQNAKIDAKLSVSSQQQVVEVQSEIAPLINTQSPVLSTTLDTRAIENLPLVSRDILGITMYLPGAVSTNPNGFVSNASVSGPISANQSVSVNGNRQQTNQYLLDGMNVNQTLDDIPGYNPSVDALGQVQVISANAPAEYGNVLGGDVVYQTKSGTNRFHGSGFFYLGNQLLNANTWGNKHVASAASITPRAPTFTRDIFGGTTSAGPIFHDETLLLRRLPGWDATTPVVSPPLPCSPRMNATATSPSYSTPPLCAPPTRTRQPSSPSTASSAPVPRVWSSSTMQRPPASPPTPTTR